MTRNPGSARKLLSAVLLAAFAWALLASPCVGGHLDGAACEGVRLTAGDCDGAHPEPVQPAGECPCPCSQAAGLSAAPTLGLHLLAGPAVPLAEAKPVSAPASPPLRIPIA